MSNSSGKLRVPFNVNLQLNTSDNERCIFFTAAILWVTLVIIIVDLGGKSFVSPAAKNEFLWLLVGTGILVGILTGVGWLVCFESCLKKVDQPDRPITGLELKQRWRHLNDHEIGLLMLGARFTLFLRCPGKKVVRNASKYYNGSMSFARISKILIQGRYFFDLDEIETFETESGFFSQADPKRNVDQTTISNLKRNVEELKQWPIHTAYLLLKMVTDPTPKERFSHRKLEACFKELQQEREMTSFFKGGLSASYLKDTWIKGLPEEFRGQRNMEK